MNQLSNQLNSQERSRLRLLKACVDKAIESHNAGGEALLEISETRLYRETHKTFEAFVFENWGLSRSRAYQIIDASKSAARLSTIVDKTPSAAGIKTESQHRELRDVSDRNLPKVIESAAAMAATENKPITAKHIKAAKESIAAAVTADMADEEPTEAYQDVEATSMRNAVIAITDARPREQENHIQKRSSAALLPATPQKGKTQSEPPPAKPRASIVRDGLGRDVPESLRDVQTTTLIGGAIGRAIDKCKREVTDKLVDEHWPLLSLQEIEIDFHSIKRKFVNAAYWTACPRCDGDGCKKCRGNGFLAYSDQGGLSKADKEALGL